MQRQHSGTARKIENCQLAVHLSYASPRVHILVDLASYLPKSWTDDPARRVEAGVPDTIGLTTKPQPARRLIETAVVGGLRCRWVAGDEAYGGDPAPGRSTAVPQSGLRPRGRLLAPRPDRTGHPTSGPDRRRPPDTGVAADLRRQWGERLPLLDWVFVTLPLDVDEHHGHHWPLIRRKPHHR